MARQPGTIARVYVDGYDLSPDGTRVEAEKSVDALEATAFTDESGQQSQSRRFVPGLKRGSIRLSAFWDDRTNGSKDVLDDILGSSKLVTVFAGDTQGNRADGAQVLAVRHSLSEPVEGLVTLDAEFEADGGVDTMRVLEPKITATASGDGAVLDNGSSTTGGATAHLQVFAADGTATIKIQHSADGVTYADLITFTQFSDRTAERLTATGTVNRYVKRNLALGTATSVTFAIAFGRNPL